MPWPRARSFEDSKPQAAHDPKNAANHADDETHGAKEDRNGESIALGKACVCKGDDHTTFTDPHPAIDTGMLEIKTTGGIRNRTCAKLTGAATALTQHHAAATVSR